ncbi:MAG: winged helix-turn-helix domain-containing protein, partial [Rubripirellula sp.]|nr:winged helix-turn-helix domain-containing protein [Rubripirellula sp.]
FQATIRGKSVRMTSKEIKVLRYFLENEGRVISRNELLSEVWNLSGNIQTRAVDQVIARVRKIIEPDKTNPIHLLTVRDAGYRFITDPNLSDPNLTSDTPEA